MSLRINTNVAALNAYGNLSNNQARLEASFQQLSSGLRINKAADDAAGLSISQGLTAQINGLTQAVSNANDGINVAQIADGALGTTQDILQRMRVLVNKAANIGTQDSDSWSAIQKEVQNLNRQLDNIAGQTKFGQTQLLDGSYDKNFQVGADSGDVIKLDLSAANVTASGIGTDTLNIATRGGTAEEFAAINFGSYSDVTDGSASISTSLKDMLGVDHADALTVAADGAKGPGNWTVSIGGTQVGTISQGTDKVYTVTNTFGGTPVEAGKFWDTDNGPNPGVTYDSVAADADLDMLRSALDSISNFRSQIGAVQNQLSYTVDNLQTGITNVTASRSNLTDADLAEQVTAMTQSQILMQASTSVLAQANSAPQAILQLLQ